MSLSASRQSPREPYRFTAIRAATLGSQCFPSVEQPAKPAQSSAYAPAGRRTGIQIDWLEAEPESIQIQIRSIASAAEVGDIRFQPS